MEHQKPEKKSKKKVGIIGGIVGAVVLSGVFYFVSSMNLVSTDNAQLDADIIPIRSSVQGYVKEIRFVDNQQVHKGDTLILIDDTDLRTKVAQAIAAQENAKANLLAAQNSASASTSNANATSLNSSSSEDMTHSANAKLTKSKADFKRIENMFLAKAATQAQFDAAKAELDMAQAQYEAAMAQFKASSAQSQGVRSQAEAQKAQITLAEAIVKQRDAEVALANTQLNNASIIAPCNGVISRRNAAVGQYITIAQPLCSAVDMDKLWISANFKETQIQKLKVGQPVEIKLDAFPDSKLTGTVKSFIGATGAKFSLLPPDNSTGNFVKITQRIPVRIELNALSAEQRSALFPGLSAFVEVNTK